MRVLIVDDHEVVRDGLSLLLKDAFSIYSFLFASDGRQAIQKAINFPVDLVLLDLSMPEGLDGLTTLQELRKLVPKGKIVVFSMYDETDYQRKAYELGADGYLVKQLRGQQLIESLQQILEGKKIFDQTVLEEERNTAWESPFSPREQEVFILTAKGYSRKQIAEFMSISIKTVENHRGNISKKLGTKNKHDWMEYAEKHRMLDLY